MRRNDKKKITVELYFYSKNSIPVVKTLLPSPFLYYISMTVPDFLEHDRDVGFLSAFKTPAKARYFLDITERDQIDLLPIAYSFAREQGIPLMIIGGGTNCLFAFDVYEGIIVRNRYSGYSEPFEEKGNRYIRVHSGEMSTVFALALYRHYSISVLVPWTGLPGTMG